MISLTMWCFFWSTFLVRAPPSLNIHYSRSHGNLTPFVPHLINNHSKLLPIQQNIKINHNRTNVNYQPFDINAYRSSWTFVDKNTVRVRFRLYESLLPSILATRFLVRHTRTNIVRTYDEQYEIINSTITLYLQNIQQGRHTVCLLLYTSKLMRNPRHIFCQDIVFNFHKYGHHDIDSDEYGNTFFFLLTQYAIVVGILIILQLVYSARKRRFLRAVYEKANSLRNFMLEHHRRLQDNKSTPDLNNHSHTLDYLIYNLNRDVLYNFDKGNLQSSEETIHTNEVNDSPLLNVSRRRHGKHLKIPSHLHQHSILKHRRSIPIITAENLDLHEEILDENELEIPAYEEESVSFKSISHILETNKPWMVKLQKNGNIEHSIVSPKIL